MVGRTLADLAPRRAADQRRFVKASIFPRQVPGDDPVLGPEMRSTGEVMGLPMISVRPSRRPRTARRVKLPLRARRS
jgi:hypothetical protein